LVRTSLDCSGGTGVAKPGWLVRSDEHPIRHAGPIRLRCAKFHPRYRGVATRSPHHHAFSKLTHANRLFEHDGCPAKNFLSFLFDIQESFTSTDSRDKIFAFLGLKKNLDPPVVLPDYSRNAAEVFADAAISFIQAHRRLTCLGWLKEMKSGFANAKMKSLTCHHGRQTGLRNSTASAHFILWTFRINSTVLGTTSMNMLTQVYQEAFLSKANR
jgi:hypothetical protein